MKPVKKKYPTGNQYLKFNKEHDLDELRMSNGICWYYSCHSVDFSELSSSSKNKMSKLSQSKTNHLMEWQSIHFVGDSLASSCIRLLKYADGTLSVWMKHVWSSEKVGQSAKVHGF